MKEYLVEEARGFGEEGAALDPENLDAVVTKFEVLVAEDQEGPLLNAEPRIKALFRRWDADGSGFLEVAELNRVVAMYNGEAWEKMDDAARTAHGENFISLYDDNGEADLRLDYREMKEYIVEEARSFGEEGAALDPADLDLVLTKFEELVGAAAAVAEIVLAIEGAEPGEEPVVKRPTSRPSTAKERGTLMADKYLKWVCSVCSARNLPGVQQTATTLYPTGSRLLADGRCAMRRRGVLHDLRS